MPNRVEGINLFQTQQPDQEENSVVLPLLISLTLTDTGAEF